VSKIHGHGSQWFYTKKINENENIKGKKNLGSRLGFAC
jgi:hypothetical protein